MDKLENLTFSQKGIPLSGQSHHYRSSTQFFLKCYKIEVITINISKIKKKRSHRSLRDYFLAKAVYPCEIFEKFECVDRIRDIISILFIFMK